MTHAQPTQRCDLDLYPVGSLFIYTNDGPHKGHLAKKIRHLNRDSPTGNNLIIFEDKSYGWFNTLRSYEPATLADLHVRRLQGLISSEIYHRMLNR